MFSFYTKLLIIKNNNLDSPQSIAANLNIHPFVAKSYHRASNKYSIDKIKQILEYLSELDLVSKGIKSLKFNYNTTVREMSYKLF